MELLAYVDQSHGNLSGPATKRILEREFSEYHQAVYQRVSHISVAQIYRFRNSAAYRKRNTTYQPTRPTSCEVTMNNDVVAALAGDIEARDIEGLCVDVGIDRKREECAKLFRGDGARREDGLVEVGAGSLVIVLGGGDDGVDGEEDCQKDGEHFGVGHREGERSPGVS